MLILIPGIVVALALVLLLVIVFLCQRHHSKKNSNQKPKAANNRHQITELCPLTAKTPARPREFPISHVRFLQELGEGTFGKVYKGDLLGLFGDNTVTKVAIKTMKENSAPKVQNDFRREVDLMSELRHPNIVCLLGVCMKQDPMSMLFEYMTLGDLHEYLLTHSPHSDISAADDDGSHKAILDYTDMLMISVQVSAGMEYLSSHHFVHRDLAARNVLVGDHLTVKISDFGLSRDIYSSDYYRVQSKSFLPVRWMPPESIMYGKFTTETDVWSFGVVLWEIFSYGLQPYYGYSNQEVIEMIRSRQILPCPDECPARMYGLMVECWHEMPQRRPSFRETHCRLRAWKSEILMQNPHWSISQSQSAHSSSTTQSGPSHHSSTGPSNTTNMTGLTGSSNTSDPPMLQPMYSHLPPASAPPLMAMPPMPNHHHGMVQNAVYMPPVSQTGTIPGPVQGQRPPMTNYQTVQFPNTNGPMKISPPGSIASHKSSNSSTSQGSTSVENQKFGQMPPQSNMANHLTNNVNGPPTIAVSECNKYVSPVSHNNYIPEQRTVNI